MGKVEIKIGTPCSEKWDSFERKGSNAFCQSCEKEVVDFTKMSDRQIKNYFVKGNGNVCGRMRKNQQKIYVDPKPAFPKSLASALIAGSSLFFTATVSVAQTKDQLEHRVRERFNLEPLTESAKTVSGTVTDDAGESLPGANVVIKGTTTGISTGFDGKFKIGVPPGTTLVFSYVGFETQEIEVGSRSSIDITLGGVTVLGGMVMGEVSSRWYSPRGLWWRIKGVFRKRSA